MFSKRKMRAVPVVVLALMLLMPSAMALAADRDRDRGGHDNRRSYRYHDRPSFGLTLSFAPAHSYVVTQGRVRYYYYDGLYYSRTGSDYLLIPPPTGAVVSAIPVEYRPVVINGVTYYTDSGIYYVYTRGGYQVVPQPLTVVQPAPAVVQAPPVVAQALPTPAAGVSADEVFTVNIPDKKGGYSSVVIKRSGAGFAGPQGEFYPEFPKITQLQVMYLK